MLLLICNRELLFIGKRKDEDDMAKSTKTYEERIRALEKKEQESIEATKKLIAQRKELEKRKKAEESKKRTHRLCQIGGAVESVLGCPIEEEDLPKLIGFLKRQETNGKFFSKAMQKEPLTDMEEVSVKPDPARAFMIARDFGVKPEDVAFVGDSDVDMMTAKNAGMLPIGVSWGYRSAEVLQDAGAAYVAANSEELYRIIKAII